MLKVNGIREAKLYQEAKEEGLQEGVERERHRSISAMAAMRLCADDIALFLGLDIELVRKSMAKTRCHIISELSALKMPAADIAKLVQLDVEMVRETIAKNW